MRDVMIIHIQISWETFRSMSQFSVFLPLTTSSEVDARETLLVVNSPTSTE